MKIKLTNNLRKALERSAGNPVEIQDEHTQQDYVLMSRDDFRRLVYDDSELEPREMLAAAGEAIDDSEGWGAAGMNDYDRDSASQ